MVRPCLDCCDGQLLGVEVVEHQVGGGVSGVDGVDVASNGRARKYRLKIKSGNYNVIKLLS